MSFDLEGNALGDEGLAALVALSHIARSKALYLEANGIAGDGVRALARADMPSLEKLKLGLVNDGAAELAGARWKDRLEHLSVWVLRSTNGGWWPSNAGYAGSPRARRLGDPDAVPAQRTQAEDGEEGIVGPRAREADAVTVRRLIRSTLREITLMAERRPLWPGVHHGRKISALTPVESESQTLEYSG